MAPRLEVKLSRTDRIYRPPDVVDGTVEVSTLSNAAHRGLRLTATGSVLVQPSSKGAGIIESLYGSVKPTILMKKVMNLSESDELPSGTTSFRFRIPLDTAKDDSNVYGILYETYHGAYINIQYVLTAELARGYLQKPLTATLEFIVEGRKGPVPKFSPEFANFYITQDTQKHLLSPVVRSGGFKVAGRVATRCSISEPVTGELTVEHCGVPIRSIEIQLLRVETFCLSDRMGLEKTQVQASQIADGDVCRGMALPIYVILPRLLTCPVLSAASFGVEFELSILVVFDLGSPKHGVDSKEAVASESLPLRLYRT